MEKHTHCLSSPTHLCPISWDSCQGRAWRPAVICKELEENRVTANYSGQVTISSTSKNTCFENLACLKGMSVNSGPQKVTGTDSRLRAARANAELQLSALLGRFLSSFKFILPQREVLKTFYHFSDKLYIIYTLIDFISYEWNNFGQECVMSYQRSNKNPKMQARL